MTHFWAGSFCRCYSDVITGYKEILNGYGGEYSVSFDCANIKDGCICYAVIYGSCGTGLCLLHVIWPTPASLIWGL
jgi:hypothetical protein